MLLWAICALLLASQAPHTPTEQLHAAARSGDVAEVTRLLDSGVNVDARDDLGSTPLLEAAWEGHGEVVRVLLAHGANVNASRDDATALQYAVLTGRAAIVAQLLKAGARTDVRDRFGATVLHLAAGRGPLDVLTLLLEAHADIEAVDQADHTPLETAIFQNQWKLVPVLLAHGANASRASPVDGRQPIHLACIRGLAAVIPELVAAGASPVAKDRFGQTPLDLALAYKNGNVVAALLKLTSIKESQAAADSAMEAAALRGQTEIVRILADNGYDVNRPTPSGSTCLNDAALKGQKKVAQLLLEHGAKVNVPDSSGSFALHNAAIGGDADMVAMMLDHGAEIDARDAESGATALMLAASLGRAAAVRLLLQRGANAKLADKAGHTALDRARQSDSPETIDLLSHE